MHLKTDANGIITQIKISYYYKINYRCFSAHNNINRYHLETDYQYIKHYIYIYILIWQLFGKQGLNMELFEVISGYIYKIVFDLQSIDDLKNILWKKHSIHNNLNWAMF